MTETPSFRNPPVIEVSFGFQFARIARWQTRHFGDFWNYVKSDFPGTADAPPVELATPTSPPIEVLLLPPLRRVLFASVNQTKLLQVQDNRFHLNWRKTRAEDQYPRFATLFPEFKKSLNTFLEFLKEKMLSIEKPLRFELTYVNHIDVDAKFSEALQKYVNLFDWSAVSAEYLPPPSTINAAWQFEMAENLGTMNANLTHVKDPENKELLVLALSCSGEQPQLEGIDHWFDIAHKSIVFGFKDLTTPAGHEFWGIEQ